MGRARQRLLVTAVDSDTDGSDREAALPSPFCYEIAQWAGEDAETAALQPVSAPRVLSAAALVGRLRGVVCAPDGAVDNSTVVARQRNWPGWPKPGCLAPTRPAGTA